MQSCIGIALQALNASHAGSMPTICWQNTEPATSAFDPPPGHRQCRARTCAATLCLQAPLLRGEPAVQARVFDLLYNLSVHGELLYDAAAEAVPEDAPALAEAGEALLPLCRTQAGFACSQPPYDWGCGSCWLGAFIAEGTGRFGVSLHSTLF